MYVAIAPTGLQAIKGNKKDRHSTGLFLCLKVKA
jgi:hypothetical protein